MRRLRRLAWCSGGSLVLALVHEFAARGLVDYGVAGALLAGGGDWTSIAAALGFLLLRLGCLVGLAAAPTWVLWWWWRDAPRRQRLRGRASPY